MTAIIPNEDLPCMNCERPETSDVRHWIGSGALDGADNRTPSGLPLMCCRVRVVGAAPQSLETGAPSSRRV